MKLLDEIMISAPCPVSWDTMEGDNRVRYCGTCSRNVYNLSDMSSTEAERFLQENGTAQCLRLYRRADGKVMTDNCPRGLRAIRRTCTLALTTIAGLLSSLFAFAPVVLAKSNSAHAKKSHSSARKSTKLKPPPLMVSAGLPAFGVGPKRAVMLDADGCSDTNITKAELDSRTATAGVLKETPEWADQRAYNLYLQGQESEKKGSLLLAQTYYSHALKEAAMPSNADPKLQTVIKHAMSALAKKMGETETEHESSAQMHVWNASTLNHAKNQLNK
jgi:hypothetical protein